MLSFELKKGSSSSGPEELQVYLDRNGLESLLTQLAFLKDDRTEHFHLMAESWGGSHLDESPQKADNVPLRHVEFLLRR